MQANLNSFTAKLYRWYYVADTMPTNLCPYFWKCVLMYLFIIPYTIISLPIIILRLSSRGFDSSVERFFLGLVIYFVLYIVLSILFAWTTIWFVDKATIEMLKPIYVTGLMVGFVGAFWGACYLIKNGIDNLSEKARYRKYEKSLEPKKDESIVKAFIKAKYHKYCPKIDWK